MKSSLLDMKLSPSDTSQSLAAYATVSSRKISADPTSQQKNYQRERAKGSLGCFVWHQCSNRVAETRCTWSN